MMDQDLFPRRSSPPWPLALAVCVVLLLALGLGGCGGGGRSKTPEGSGLWIAQGSAPLEAGDLAALETLSLKNVFGEAAILRWEGQRPRLEGRSRLDLPRRTPVTLVVGGSWASGLDAAAAAKALTEEVRRVSLEADAAGLVAEGFHFEVDASGELESFGRTLGLLREALPRTQRVSAGVRRGWLEDPSLEILADGVDFVVAWLYGQRPEALEEDGWQSDAWDLRQVEFSLRRLEEHEVPYLVGVVTLGMTVHLSSSGRVRELRAGGALRPLVRHPSLGLDHGFVLAGMDCRRYDFTAEGDTTVEGASPEEEWTLKRGEQVRSVSLGSSRVREYRLLLPVLDLSHRLGDLFYRLPGPLDDLSVGQEGFQDALGSSTTEAQMVVSVEQAGRQGPGLAVIMGLRNPGTEATEVAFVDRNYLEVKALSGHFGRISPGDFQRYQLLRQGPDGSLRPSLRNANVLRLFEPLLDPGGEVRSGPLQVLGARGIGDIEWQLNYLLGDGTELRQASTDSVEAPDKTP